MRLPATGLSERACYNRSRRSEPASHRDRKSTRLNSSHMSNSYAVFRLKKKSGGGQRACLPVLVDLRAVAGAARGEPRGGPVGGQVSRGGGVAVCVHDGKRLARTCRLGR